MLLLKGNVGKSKVVDAIQKYNNARVYVYDEEPIQTLDSYFISSKEFGIEEFCKSLYRDINGLGYDNLPVNMVVIYTNLSELEIGLIEDYANTLEKNYMVCNVIVTCKI